jgi:hypothetical protein
MKPLFTLAAARVLGGLVIGAIASAPLIHGAATSEWVKVGADGKLVYKTTPQGDRILDFSHAGYMGGGVALPEIAPKVAVKPSGKADDTAAIQDAIDQVSALPEVNGFRGAVLLGAGIFHCARGLVLNVPGVVVRGSGSGERGTVIEMSGEKHIAFVIGDPRASNSAGENEEAQVAKAMQAKRPAEGFRTTVSDAYVGSGSDHFTVADASGFAVGDAIQIRRSTTAAWVELMRMHDLVRDGKKQTWVGTNRTENFNRNVRAITGQTLTLDVPLPDSLDSKYLGAGGVAVVKVAPIERVRRVGIERLRIQCPPLEIAYGRAPYSAIRVGGDDCWVRDVVCQETMNATAITGNRITMQEVIVTHTFANLGASKPSDFSIEGSQILINRCVTVGDNEYPVWTSSLVAGPNVVLNSTFRGRGSYLQPHHRWATGLLVDNCSVPDGGIDFLNRGVGGSGHGWPMGWGVVWNSVAGRYVIQSPPGTRNWAIGNIGERVQFPRFFDTSPVIPDGEYESHGTPVAPQSLYLAQLAERVGPAGVKALGYADNTLAQFPNKHVPLLPVWKNEVDPELGVDLAGHRPVDTNAVRGTTREFGGEKALDGDPATYWATDDGVAPAQFIVDVEGPLEINAAVIEEAAGKAGQITSYKLEGQVDSDWKLLGEGTAIGEHLVIRFPAVTIWKVRLTVLKAAPYAAIRKFGIYRAR